MVWKMVGSASLCWNCTKMWFLSAFLLGVWNLATARVRVFLQLVPIKTLGTESMMSFSGKKYLTHVVTTCVYDSAEIGLLEAHGWFLLVFTSSSFSLCWSCFVPFHCNKPWPWGWRVRCPVSPHTEPSRTWGWSWEYPQHTMKCHKCRTNPLVFCVFFWLKVQSY